MHFDKEKYKVWTWKHPLVLHWMLNPGLAVNELLLGQCVPKVMLIEKDKTKPLAARSFIPCPHCGTLHPASKWSAQNGTAFKNWFGLYCNSCSNIIPPVRNLTSLLIMGITLPVWYPFKNQWKRKWLQKQKEKFSRPQIFTVPVKKWWQEGLGWGVMMFILMNLTDYLFLDEKFTWLSLLISAVTWTLGGLLFGLFIKPWMGKQSADGKLSAKGK